jgi:phosphoribosylaminoimidazolecarboxamide formyltransferase/IMP cyclohydrolase
MSEKRIKSALISVYYKDELEEIVRTLDELKVKIYSTGGTFGFIKDLGIPAETVEWSKHSIPRFSEVFLPGGTTM